jgi:Predicted flavoprotein
MKKPIKILGISGSIRKESYNTLLIMETQKISEDLLKNQMHISIYPLNNIPLYNNDLESDFHFPKERKSLEI